MHRTYENGDIVVFWDSEKCFHAKKCVGGCPEVFNIQRKPWIDLSRAPSMEIWKAIDKCPSGALSCVYSHEIRVELDSENLRSVAMDKDRQIGECDYEETPEGRVIYHTEVIPEYEGRGIAKRLVYKILEASEREGKKVIPTCSYAVKLLGSNKG